MDLASGDHPVSKDSLSPPSAPVTRHPSRVTGSPWKILRLLRVGSTQDVAREKGEAGLVVVAEVQERGRGRRGAFWHSPKGGLWLSAVLPPPAPLHIQVATAVAKAIKEFYRLPISTKPPNDLQLFGRKLGGVLVETLFQGEAEGPVVIGVGINVNNPIPEEVRGTAISLREALGGPVDLEKTLEIVLSALDDLSVNRRCRE